MYHFTNPSGKQNNNTGYCRYCGRPLKNHGSINQDAGDVCLAKHRRTRVRRIGEKVGVENGPDKPESDTDSE